MESAQVWGMALSTSQIVDVEVIVARFVIVEVIVSEDVAVTVAVVTPTRVLSMDSPFTKSAMTESRAIIRMLEFIFGSWVRAHDT